MKEADEIMSKFGFGETFLALNREPLEAYASAKSRSMLQEEEEDFFGPREKRIK